VWDGLNPVRHDQFSESSRFSNLMERYRTLTVAEVLATGTPVRDVERAVERAAGTTLIVSVNIDPLMRTAGGRRGELF
jgi:hypothetical protein